MSRPYTADDAARLRRALREYHEMAEADAVRYLLRTAFDHPGFSIMDYCRNYRPNPHAIESEDAIKQFANRFGLWIPGMTEHCNDMNAYLYPGARAQRLTRAGKTYAISWFLNDTIGRECFSGLSHEEQRIADQTRDRVVRASRTMSEPAAAIPVERACLDMLEGLRSSSKPEWFASFQSLWLGHLRAMCQNGNARARGVVPTAAEYVEDRIRVSGMDYAVALTEFTQNQYLDWTTCQCPELSGQLRRLAWLCAVVGCIANDLFSFEKEFVKNGSDANFVLVTLLNNGRLTLSEAFAATIEFVRRRMIEFMDHVRMLAAHGDPVRSFVLSMEWIVMATWVWETRSKRYKSRRSIFQETRL